MTFSASVGSMRGSLPLCGRLFAGRSTISTWNKMLSGVPGCGNFSVRDVFSPENGLMCQRKIHLPTAQMSTGEGDGSSQMSDMFAEMADDTAAHSAESESRRKKADKEEALHARLLDASLTYVSQHDWTIKALEMGAADCDLPVTIVKSLPHGGICDLILHHLAVCRDQILDLIDSERASAVRNASPLDSNDSDGKSEATSRSLVTTAPVDGERDKGDSQIDTSGELSFRTVERLLTARLHMNLPLVHRLASAKSAMLLHADDSIGGSLMMLPNPVTTLQLGQAALQIELETIGAILRHAGDQSSNLDWYNRRLALLTIYKAAELIMIGSASDAKAAQITADFVRRRVQDFATIQRLCNPFTAGDHPVAGGSTPDGANPASSTDGSASIKHRVDSAVSMFIDVPGDLGGVLRGAAHTAKSLAGIANR